MRTAKAVFRFLTRRILWLVAFVLKSLLVKKVIEFHRENVPEQGSLIIATNHVSSGEDPGVILLSFPDIVILYKKELEEGSNPLTFVFGQIARLFLRGAGFIPVRRDEKALSGINHMHQVLSSSGRILGLPEGTSRGHTALIEAKRKGVCREAMAANCPVLPVALYDTPNALTDGLFFRGRHIVKVIYGKPLLFSDLGISFENDPTGEKATTALMSRIASMLPPEKRGFYSRSAFNFLSGQDPDVGYYRSLQPLVQQLS